MAAVASFRQAMSVLTVSSCTCVASATLHASVVKHLLVREMCLLHGCRFYQLRTHAVELEQHSPRMDGNLTSSGGIGMLRCRYRKV